jgi:hypothetical protein
LLKFDPYRLLKLCSNFPQSCSTQPQISLKSLSRSNPNWARFFFPKFSLILGDSPNLTQVSLKSGSPDSLKFCPKPCSNPARCPKLHFGPIPKSRSNPKIGQNPANDFSYPQDGTRSLSLKFCSMMSRLRNRLCNANRRRQKTMVSEPKQPGIHKLTDMGGMGPPSVPPIAVFSRVRMGARPGGSALAWLELQKST